MTPGTTLTIALTAALLGACGAKPDRPFCEPGVVCAAASEEHCADGPEASRYGRALFANGTCVARDDASCRAASLTCALWGQCHAPTASATGSCALSDDRDFAASRQVACGAGTCVAQGDDCKEARVCTLEGRCRAKDGVCVADATSCAASELCKTMGWCSLSGDACRPASQADCARARTCTAFGHCAYGGGRCNECARSQECRAEGLCHHLDVSCIARDPRHCMASLACQREGRCRAYQGACVR